MRLYLEKSPRNGEPAQLNFIIAAEAFRHFGFHLIETETASAIPLDDRDCVAVGSIQYMQDALEHLGLSLPADISYPASLRHYLGRSLSSSTIDEISNDPGQWPVFVKPRNERKKFTGRVIRSFSDLRGGGDQENNTPVWVSGPVVFLREWRVFVRYGRILDIRPYKGSYRFHYDPTVIENAVRDFVDAPAAYAMDFGVTDQGRTLLVEVNEGFSIGAYGLFYTDYARLLATRWAQLTGYEDLCAFDR
ncbi:ATP-grasp domain-containing protein [Taibaiella koreensis]|uniref:ATP-grasp domain-containing protein n=1 Tax=Taibaiella koreensis TaxID=1268548 RepID=UPI000E5A0DDB|nr:ATP-grasp domain-containing protein [Taibaiella koreensis]